MKVTLTGILILFISLSQANSPDSLYELPKYNQDLNLEILPVMGWNHPYASGIEVGFYGTDKLNFNAGVGYSLFSGTRWGVGFKYFFRESEQSAFFLGTNYAMSQGVSDVELKDEEKVGIYNVESGSFVSLRGGMRFAAQHFNIYFNAGYNIVVDGGKSEYVSGNNEEVITDMARGLELGGAEFSLGFGFGVF